MIMTSPHSCFSDTEDFATVALKLVPQLAYTPPVTPAGLNRVEQGQETTRHRVLKAAQTCFLERGYRQTTTTTIADRAGLTERTLFNLFPSKAELFRDAVAAAVSELGEGGRVRDMAEVRDLAAAPTWQAS